MSQDTPEKTARTPDYNQEFIGTDTSYCQTVSAINKRGELFFQEINRLTPSTGSSQKSDAFNSYFFDVLEMAT